ncbi:MAG: acetyl-CoA carboxylase carboxyltransferase subunit alpha [Armatimonadetes bacterium]|nr:acetyl-CoA carboxylase carboxyltransferase subunit alpha [Armatimonadota bacterium]
MAADPRPTRLGPQQAAPAQPMPTTRLSAWEIVQLARHPQRPKAPEFIEHLIVDFTELHGDRLFRDDPALLAGFGWFEGQPVAVIGPYKGRDTKENLAHNFGMPNPEGYRKALRVMKLAEKFGRPVLSFIDTPAAYPGDDAEERGQAQAIAQNIAEMSALRVPIVVVITGEGGSGGALAMGVGDVVLMLENAIYTVIPPEGCAAILWRDAGRAQEAAEALRLTARDLRGLGIIDEIITEPEGGAQTDPDAAMLAAREAVGRHLGALAALPVETLLERRYQKYRIIGRQVERLSRAR